MRVKESDRLAATADMLRVSGVTCEISGDDLIVEGRGHVPGGGLVATHMDHRIAMSALVMGLAADRPVKVDDTAFIATSFPDFIPMMRSLGADLTDQASAVSAALKLDPEKFGDPGLKTQVVGDAASVVSAYPKVREALLNFQRQFANRPPGAVLDGRDIGTVICPDANVKIFVVAAPEVRARRRTLELRARGEEADEAAILADILKRDERDRNRAVAPLKPADDAYLLDNSHLDIEGGVRAAIDIVEAVRAGRREA